MSVQGDRSRIRAYLRPERTDFGTEKADCRQMDRQTDLQTYIHEEIHPFVLQDISLLGPLPKKGSWSTTIEKKGLEGKHGVKAW